MKQIILTLLLVPFYLFGQTNTWTGTTDTDWHKTCNWSLNLIPTCAHDVVVPTATNYPIVTGIAHCLSLSITSAASNALTINSGGGGRLDISSSGGSCSGTATDNGGCINCTFVWASANLNVGTLIYNQDQEDNGTLEKHCRQGLEANCTSLGAFYVWGEATDYNGSFSCDPCGGSGNQGICPAGYHIPTDLEWSRYEYCVENTIATTGSTSLSTFQTSTGWRGTNTSGVGPGSKLKAVSTTWDGTNASGFNAIPSGSMDGGGEFHFNLNFATYFWTATDNGAGNGYYRELNSSEHRSRREQTSGASFSVRCLQN